MNKVKDCRYGPMIYNTLDTWVGRSFDLYGEFSQQEVDFLLDLISAGDVVIDVGANIGGLTIPFARKLDGSGYVLAIEPQESVFHILCGNIALNNLYNVKPLHRAASATPNAIIHVPNVDYTKTGNFGGISLVDQKEKHMNCIVSSVSIDQLALSRVNLIKIDVEGMELEVLKGAENTIERLKPYLYVEFDREENRSDIIKFVERHGYDWQVHSPPLFNENNFFGNSIDLLRIEGMEDKNIISINLFCTPRK